MEAGNSVTPTTVATVLVALIEACEKAGRAVTENATRLIRGKKPRRGGKKTNHIRRVSE